MMLPTNQHIFDEIYGIRLATTPPPWNKLLDTSCTYKLLYSLQIVDSLVRIEERDSPVCCTSITFTSLGTEGRQGRLAAVFYILGRPGASLPNLIAK